LTSLFCWGWETEVEAGLERGGFILEVGGGGGTLNLQ